MIKQPKVSIVVPVYNAKKYLQECIESIIQQKLEDIQIILIDDGSSDGSDEICDYYARIDSRVNVIHQENGGLVAARKRGLAIATGKYVGYVDADDFVESEYFEQLYRRAEENHADVVACGYTLENKGTADIKINSTATGVYEGRKCELLYEHMLYNGIYYQFGIIPNVWNKLFRRETLWECQMRVPEQIRLGEDVACSYPAIMKAKNVVIDNSCVMYHYRIVHDSMTKRIDKHGFESLYVLYLYLEEEFRTSETATKHLEYYKTYLLDLEWKRIWECKNVMNYREKKELMKPLYCEYNDLLQKLPHDLPCLLKLEILCVKHKLFFILPILVSIRKSLKM